jgi:type I restriction enzyme S subunit
MKNKSLTPQIRFKGYDDEWQQAKVRDVFTLGNGYTPSKANPAFWTNGTIPWFRMEDIRENGRVLADSIQHVTPEAVKSSGLFPAGCIIVSTTATIGEHALLIADSLANQQFTVFQTVNRWSWLKAKYLLYRFYGLGDWCRKNVNAGGLAAVSITDLQKYDIDFPSTAEERDSIADYFDNIDKLLVDTEREITRLEKMKQASLQKMFPRPGETTPEIRFDGFTEPWKMKSISQILTIGNGCDYKHLSKGIIPVFGTGGIMTHVSKCLYDGESVFIGRKGTIDKPLYFNGKFWTVDTLFYTHSFVDAVPYFVYCLFQKINWQSYNAATGVPSLSKDVINTIEVTIPLPDEQKAIANYFRNLDAIISAKRKKLEKLQNLKQSCLDKMFVNTTAQ